MGANDRQRGSLGEQTRKSAFEGVFPCRVFRVDYERHSLTIQNLNDQNVYSEVRLFPAVASSIEGMDQTMPEVGQRGLGVFLSSDAGYVRCAVTAWTGSDVLSGLDAVAHRSTPTVEGFSDRHRGVHRKAYPGDRSATNSQGLHEFQDAGWDRYAPDLSQDTQDVLRREWTRTTGRRTQLTDAGLSFEGPVLRPDATGVTPEPMPDGTARFPVLLTPGADGRDRYLKGSPDLLPFSEHLDRVTEFPVDFPVPAEALETDYLDFIYGVTADPWARTTVTSQEGIGLDDHSYLADQGIDHPTDGTARGLGPTTSEGATPARKGYILEKAAGTLVGYNRFDAQTYGKVLKPSLFPLTRGGRFGTDTESTHVPVVDSTDHSEARLAASAWMMRFPHEYNTTRMDITKEGMLVMEVGATLPKERIPWDSGAYEHPYGAGRSLEAHLVGSARLVLGKNRDEEDSLDLTTLGQAVIRLGADDGSLPQTNRAVHVATRGQKDAVLSRDLPYWMAPKLKPGDAGDLENKTGAERVSARMAFDGGTFIRLGARNPGAKRRHLKNGYLDGPGLSEDVPGGPTSSRAPGRPTYGTGDSAYRFHDLTQAGKSRLGTAPYFWSGDPVQDPDTHGLSMDLHAVRDILLRIGKNIKTGQSCLLDTNGGLVLFLGKDMVGRSITGTLDGGIELAVGSNSNGQALQLEIIGDANVVVKGNLQHYVTGDYVLDVNGSIFMSSKKDFITKAVNHRDLSLVQTTREAPDVTDQQGGFAPTGPE